jgi:LPS-assembly protein
MLFIRLHFRRKAVGSGKSIKITGAHFSRNIAVTAWMFLTLFSQPAQPQARPEGQVRTEIPDSSGTIVIISDTQERISKHRYRATGNVVVTYQDMMVTGEAAEYDEETKDGFMIGPARFSQGQQWLTCSKAEFNFGNRTAVFYDASGYVDKEFLISARTIYKTGADTYRADSISITECKQKRPNWSFGASRADIRLKHTVRLYNMTFKVKGIPVFFSPYLIFPLEKKSRSSGFVPFHTGTSNSKGRVFSEGYYQTLGPSADLMVYGDYFSLRGLAIGGTFRIKPNPETHFSLQAYGIHDKLGQGGVQLMVDGESLLKDDWRAVARVNTTSNFIFRQAFADSFRAATVPQELATVFLARDHNSISTNIAFERREVAFPVRSLVLRKMPSLELSSVGTPLGQTPFILSFRTSMDGLSRTDSLTETPGLMQRLDLYPRLTLRLPSLMGFSLMPSAGVRETYYSAQLSADSSAGVLSQALHRRYTDLNVELRMPVLERDFASSPIGSFKHFVEPFVTYRWINGIKDLYKTIRFDEEDAIANTNEVEYGIINRFHRIRKISADTQENFEFMSFSLTQKHYFDPSFGGAFQAGKFNTFYPLDTVTGFYQSGVMRHFSPISAIFRVTPKDGLHNELRADFDPSIGHWRNESILTAWQKGKFAMSGTYFGIQALEPGMPAGSHIEGGIQYGSPKRGLLTSFGVAYNIRTSQLLNSGTHVGYAWDCCGVDMDFNQFDLGVRRESQFSFSFSLKGFGSFGNMKRPGNLF